MCDILYMQLKIEQDTRAKLIATGRVDMLASLLLRRIEAEIIKIEEAINGEEQDESAKRADTGGFMANVLKALYHLANIKEGGASTVFPVFEGTKPQRKAVTE